MTANSQISARYCQSCGLPLRNEAEIGLYLDPRTGSSEECCLLCIQSNEYTADRSMEEMIGIWVEYAGWYNEYVGTDYTPQEIREVFRERLPTLSRWKQRAETEHLHEQAVGRVTRYIADHLSENLDMETLIDMSHLSRFHFRRIFRQVTGENIAQYIRRLRLEQVAHLALTTGLGLEQIVSRTHYQTSSALAKAFKKYFGMPVHEYRTHYRQQLASKNCSALSPEIRSVDGFSVVYVEVGEASRYPVRYRALWSRLFTALERIGLNRKQTSLLSISADDPLITPPDQCRYYLGAVLPSEKIAEGESVMRIPGGKYAILRHTGGLISLHEVYRSLYEEWLPGSGYRPRGTMTFEIYASEPETETAGELVTDIYLPVEKASGV